VVADVVLANPNSNAEADAPERIKNDLLEACRRTLASHKIPAMLRFVPSLEFTAAGKLVRPSAETHTRTAPAEIAANNGASSGT
jgi:acyl-CoA synthetase (AMP-forming)/AMP-acid ligase II